MDTQFIGKRVREIASRVARESELEFVHSEIAGPKRNLTVRIFIDKPGGVTLEDCAQVSQQVERILDADDFIPSKYVLEVSSPGLDRELYSLDDFKKFTGLKAKVKTRAPIEDQNHFNGKIVEIDRAEVIFEDRTIGTVRIAFDNIEKANLKVDLEEEFKKKQLFFD